jgi:hypothetical protein
MTVSLEQSRHEFAPDEVTGAPKKYEIKSHEVAELHKIWFVM